MSSEHDDDEIRESIQCVAFPHSMGGAVLPIGYSILFEPLGRCIQVLRRGVLVPGAHSEADAWSDAIAREKARREREVQASAADKATAMLAEVIRERDELMAKLERVRKVQRWELEATDSRYMVRSEDGRYVHHAHIAAIIGEDG